ncbi:MAG: glycoside hydrolase family 9 protein, partial [bacterium]
MNRIFTFNFFILALLSLLCSGAIAHSQGNSPSATALKLTNPSHLNHLFEKVHVNDHKVGIIHIYAEAPDYRWVGDDDEGIACIDDAARAAVFYLRHYEITNENESLQHAQLLLKFILQMQAKNGLFYNFVWPDLSIHKDGRTTKNILGWWTARAIWAFGEGTSVFRKIDPQFADALHKSARATYSHLDTLMKDYGRIEKFKGFAVPQWLLYRSAADATSELMLGLSAFLQDAQNPIEQGYLHKFAEALLCMQQGDATHFPHGAFLSWKNIWHGWGNSQAYALLRTSRLVEQKTFFDAAKLEVDHFYPYLSENDYIREIVFSGSVREEECKKNLFEQIAYSIRPMVMATITLYRQTGEIKYAQAAARYASWFFGNNIAKTSMYDPKTGRCFDGIKSAKDINRNAGAESTIEALLVMIEIEKT